jgi:hypothetical protein
MNAADEISQAERRRIMSEERRMKTYHGHALDGEPELSGRFAKVSTTTVVGRSPGSIYSRQPAGSPWANDPVPPEMPLGIDINAQEPTGELHEQKASITDGTSVIKGGPGAVMSSPPRSGRGFRRRA